MIQFSLIIEINMLRKTIEEKIDLHSHFDGRTIRYYIIINGFVETLAEARGGLQSQKDALIRIKEQIELNDQSY